MSEPGAQVPMNSGALLEELARSASDCQRCPLAKERNTVVFGEGNPNSPIVFVGEGPGREEDLTGRPFVGRSGQLLSRLIAEELGKDRSAFYIANVVKCRPPGNRDPEPFEIAQCSSYLSGQLRAIDPQVVVTLGAFATRAVMGATVGITKLRGKAYELNDRIIVPTFHPAAGLRGGPKVVAAMRADLALVQLVLRGEELPCRSW